MLEIYSNQDLAVFIQQRKKENKKIGFVPTMGALHDGHLSLVKKSCKENDITITSIFVNPTQFNSTNDLKNYPRQVDNDIKQLLKTNCDAVYIPSEQDIYPPSYKGIEIRLNPIDQVMEGKHRPGHFNGVVNVVYRLFQLIQPDKAYFGRKDFQQVAVIRTMVKITETPVDIIMCETYREPNGLAMSSRNLLLSQTEKEKASIIYHTLKLGSELSQKNTPAETKEKMIRFFNDNARGLELEYLEIVASNDLQSINKTWVKGATACIVAFCGSVRLIDNLEIYPS